MIIDKQRLLGARRLCHKTHSGFVLSQFARHDFLLRSLDGREDGVSNTVIQCMHGVVRA
jgi:hypothetical protein